jgi:hypothetical protein
VKVGATGHRTLLLIGTTILVPQATLLILNPRATVVSNLLLGIMALLAVAGCLFSAYIEPIHARKLWILLGSGFLLSTMDKSERRTTMKIAPDHPWLGLVSISAAIAIYGVRAAIVDMTHRL